MKGVGLAVAIIVGGLLFKDQITAFLAKYIPGVSGSPGIQPAPVPIAPPSPPSGVMITLQNVGNGMVKLTGSLNNETRSLTLNLVDAMQWPSLIQYFKTALYDPKTGEEEINSAAIDLALYEYAWHYFVETA